MKKLKVPYTCHIDGHVSKCECDRPFIDVTLSLGESHVTPEAMIDSGCTMTHANADLAEVLGIDLRICTEITVEGICGEGKGYMYQVNFGIEKLGKPFSGPIIFVKDLPFPVLLGQNNFFDVFNINFKKSEGYIELERID